MGIVYSEIMNNSTDNSALLEELNNVYIEAYIPAMIVLTIVIFIGVVSNLFVFIFYTFKSPIRVINFMISLLTLNDTLVNLSMIHDVVEFNYFVNYRSTVACKVSYFLKHLLVSNAVALTVAIAVDRYRLVCRPFLRQITIRIAKAIAIAIFVFSISMSMHYFWTADIVILTFKVDNVFIIGYHCSLSENSQMVTVHAAFHVIDICIHVTYIIALIISYSLIIRKIVHIRNKLNSYNLTVSNVPTSSNSCNTEDLWTLSSIRENTAAEHDVIHSCHAHPEDFSIENSVSDAMQPKRTSFKIGKTEIKLTILAFAVAISSIVCFVPYFISMAITEANMDGTGLLFTVGELIARRSFMLYSVVSPFVMMYYNESLQHFVVNICLCK